MRVRKALVVRPPGDGPLARFRFEPPRPDRTTLPIELIALASALKLGSVHRVAMHDAARDRGDAARAIAIHKPDAVLVAWHPGARGGARSIAAAARDAAKVVVAVSPPGQRGVAAADGPFDGALDERDGAGLVALLDALGEGGAPERIAAALDGDPRPVRVAPDRKLLDYARYQGSVGARWRAAVRAFRPVASLSGSPLSDKGRFAASGVLLDDDVDAIVRDVNECALLGIPWLDLRRADRTPPDPALWTELLPRLANLRSETPGLDPDLGGLRLRVSAATVGTLDAPVARRAGVVAVDLGWLDPADTAEAIDAARAARRAGWVTTAELGLGTDDAAQALLTLEEAGVAVQGRLVARPPTDSPQAFTAEMDALTQPDPEREAAWKLAREVDARADAARLVRPRRPSVRGLLRRLLRG